MKIAIHVDGPTIRGNEKQVIAVASGLSQRGHDVVVSCRRGGAVERVLKSLGIRTTGIRPRGDLDLYHAARFAIWLRRERPDALLLTSWLRDFIGGWAARRAGVPRIVLRVGGVHAMPRGRRGWKHRRALSRYVDAIIANSRALADHLRAVPDVAPVAVALNGVRIERTSPADLRAEFGIPATACIVAAAGGLERRKGFDVLIEAISKLADKNIHVVIAGEGILREQLQSLADRLALADRVHLAGQRKDIPAFLAAADVFVLSSRSESMPVALLEAMAARKPAITTEVAGAREAIAPQHGRAAAGWIVPIEDADALGSTLGEVIADLRAGGSEASQRAAEAAWRVANWFTVEQMVDAVEAVLLARR